MPTIYVISSRPLAGKTTVAVALAKGLAVSGTQVQLVRLGAGEAAAEDATTFASYFFASSPGQPISAAPDPGPNQLVVAEADAGAGAQAGSYPLLVVRGGLTDADRTLGTAAGDRLLGTIATDVNPSSIESVARDITNAGLRPLALIPEDRTLAAPSVDEIRGALGAQLLYDGENGSESVEDVLIAPVYADPARPHFRRFASKAVLAPYNKTDLHIAAIETEAACLVITGGHDPSPYVVDRAQHGITTVLLAPNETPETVASLSDVWLTSRFRGERKAAAALSHLDGRVDFSALARRIQS
jgi:BioD-like phosphotransacetylase family protein